MQINKLTDSAIKAILNDADQKPGRYTDGGGLYFVKTKTGTGNWTFVYRQGPKLREMGLGSYNGRVATVSLAQARAKIVQFRAQLGAGKDPLADKKRSAPSASFRAMLEATVASKLVGWGRNAEKQSKDWTSTLTNHAASLMDVSVTKIDTAKVLAVMTREVTSKKGVTGPLWSTMIETADRVRERIAQVIDFAKAKGLCEGDNPAAKKTIAHLLGAQQVKGTEDEHHAAMDLALIQPFWAQLKSVEGIAARALEMLMLTGARSGEVRGMVWSEVDLDEGTWNVPANRMKAGKKHTFTLSSQALDLLRALPRREGTEVVFWNNNGNPFDAVTMRRLLRSMGVSEEQATVHGFRSCFVSWARDMGHNETLAQVAIAHLIGSKVEQAYQRGKALDLRFDLLQAWADFLANPTVVPFARKVA